MKWLLFKFSFLYPRIYAFSCQYRKKKQWREFEDKAIFFFKKKKGAKRIAQGVYELRGVRKIMRYLIPHMDDLFIQRFVKTEGLHFLDQALKDGRGVVLIAGHIGVPHLSFAALRVMGYDVILLKGVTPKVPKRSKIRYYDTEENTIFVHDPSLADVYKKRILETLQSGKIIYYDGDAGEGRIKERISFLGKEMDFPTGMVYLAHQAKAAVIPFIHLYRKGKITLIFGEPLDNNWREGKRTYRLIFKKFIRLLESYVLRYPEQYMGIYGPTVAAYYYRSHRDDDKANSADTCGQRRHVT